MHATNIPQKKPDQVLFGDRDNISFLPPKILPPMYEKLSVDQTINKNHSIISRPESESLILYKKIKGKHK